MDEFNKLMEKHRLSSKQANLVRDIRRRGKNKVCKADDVNLNIQKAVCELRTLSLRAFKNNPADVIRSF